MMRIGIDIDDVMADSLPRYLQAFNRRFGLKVPVTEARWEIFRRHPEIPADAIAAFFEELYRADFLGSRPLVPGAMEGIEELHRAGHRLFIITGRPRRDRAITERWMEARGLSHFFDAIEDRDGLDAPLHKRRAATRAPLWGASRPAPPFAHTPKKEPGRGRRPVSPARRLPGAPAAPGNVA